MAFYLFYVLYYNLLLNLLWSVMMSLFLKFRVYFKSINPLIFHRLFRFLLWGISLSRGTRTYLSPAGCSGWSGGTQSRSDIISPQSPESALGAPPSRDQEYLLGEVRLTSPRRCPKGILCHGPGSLTQYFELQFLILS